MPLFEVTARDRKIYEEEIRDFLPDKIIDIHAHIWLESLIPPKPLAKGETQRTVTWPSLVARDNSLEDLQETYRLMFPGKQVIPLLFTSTRRDTQGPLNAYVADCAKTNGYPALYYSMPEQSGRELEQAILKDGFLGIKSYLSLSPDYLPEKELRIFDFFPKEQLRAMDRLGAVVMLHIPRDGRLRDPVNIAQVLEIKREFPQIRLIIAHIGRAYVKENVGNALEIYAAECPDLMFDFSANCCEYAIHELLRLMGPKNALFGSDLPILRMRTRRIEENGIYINLVPPGLYGGAQQDKHLREVSAAEGEQMTFFLYEEILAFKRAAAKLGLSRQDVQDVFYGNAERLLNGAKESIEQHKKGSKRG
ncbi:MAG: amidohydrolase [Clostridiales bacterium]|nr:amidohydrolase [Clostridiales bacterium]